ncbi:hypothetical protein N7G274_004727 [Stereocaulon virgatum]|uniref:Uncharacterized protein n=1 Tax=Stereocaulon virgatum TaxID=373712 RepID=A0ABR4A8M7_9LECA
MTYRDDPTWAAVLVHDWEAIEYCTGLICASFIHLKPFLLTIAPSVLGHTHIRSPAARTLCYRIPGYGLESRDSSRYGELGGERSVRAVISAARFRGDADVEEAPFSGIMVTTDIGVRETYHPIIRYSERTLLRPSHTF